MVAERTVRLASLAGALLGGVAVAVAPLGGGLSVAGQYAVATMVVAAVLWITGALPLPVTALLVPVLLTATGVYPDFGDAVAGFADPVIFLLLAGFVLAEALKAQGIDRRIAYHILVRLGTSPRRLVLAVMVATAGLSMIISNTATTAMMVPIAVGLVGQVTDVAESEGGEDASNLQIAMLLGIAYAASLGGVGTIIGTPPNAIVVGQLQELVGVDITFVDWLFVGLPMVAVTLPLAWYLLTHVVYPPAVTDVSGARQSAREQLREAGPLDADGRRVVAIFAATASLWLLGGLGFLFRETLPNQWFVAIFGGEGPTPFGTVGHQGVLYYVVVGLLAVPALMLSGAVEWDEVTELDWGTLLLLGGGISLANALATTDATRWLAAVTFGALGDAPLLVVLLTVVALTVAVGELASNTAMAAILAPLLVNVGPAYAGALGTTPTQASVFLAVTGAIAASYGFALPVATPPNAIAFGAGYVTREHMLRAGVLLDVVVVLTATAMVYLLSQFLWPLVL
ncbi:MAG: DASS family sodium-coupled anion symporter [Haloferacaceae archaeon]